MPKKSSKKSAPASKSPNAQSKTSPVKTAKKSAKCPKLFTAVKSRCKKRLSAWKASRARRIRLHRSFHRSYREDYARPLEIPGPLYHAMDTLRLIGKNWRLFLPLIFWAVIFNVLLVGIMSEETYVKFQEVLSEQNNKIASGEIGNFAKAGLILVSTVTTGGLSSGLSEVEIVFAVFGFLMIWLLTVFILRHRLAGKTLKLRDALYNALTPLISTFVVFVVGFLQAIPLFIVIITYSAAVQTDFLSTPFYALVYFIFAVSLLLLSGYLLSSTLIALVAVSAPGTYPLAALHTASDLMAGRRMNFLARLVFGAFFLALLWTIIMLPIITIDLFFKAHFTWCTGWPVVSIALLVMTCFSFVYISAYIYLYYRRVLAYKEPPRPALT